MQIPGLGGYKDEIAGCVVLIGILAVVLEPAAVIVVKVSVFLGTDDRRLEAGPVAGRIIGVFLRPLIGLLVNLDHIR